MLSAEQFLTLFDQVERDALRLESRRCTDLADERAELRAFLAGELPEVMEWEPDGWTEMVTRARCAGRRVRRVRVVDEPLTPYQRYMVYTGQRNTAVGEDVGYLARARADRLHLPDHDFWVLDGARVLLLWFSDDGRYLGADVVADPALVARHERWVHRALAAALPAAVFLAEDHTRAWPPDRAVARRGG
ncbi:MAG: DUF6879 family protein [Pseudonocardia sp.]